MSVSNLKISFYRLISFIWSSLVEDLVSAIKMNWITQVEFEQKCIASIVREMD